MPTSSPATNKMCIRDRVYTIVHDNMQLDGDGAVLVVNDLDALGHGFPPEQVNQAVRLGAHGHSLDAVTAGGDGTGDIGKDLASNADLTFVGLYLHGTLPFFRE